MLLDYVCLICSIFILFVFWKICRVARKGGKRRGRTTRERKNYLEHLKKTSWLSRPLTRFPGRAQAFFTSGHLAPSQSIDSSSVEHLQSPNDKAAKLPSRALPGPSQPKKSSPLVLRDVFYDIPPTEHPVPRRPSIPERAPSPLIQPCPVPERARDGGERSGSLSPPKICKPLQPRVRRRVVPESLQADPMSYTSAARAPKNRFSTFINRLRSCCCCCCSCPKRGGRKASRLPIPIPDIPYSPIPSFIELHKRFAPNMAMLYAYGYRKDDYWETSV